MKILIVEDEPKVARFIKDGLEESQFDSDVAYDGLEGEKLFLQYSYDLVILDIIIPYISGIELCRRIKARKPEIPVLMLTALGTTEDKLTGFEAGADDYLVKPFEFLELLARIKVLSRRKSGVNETVNRIRIADLELDLNKKNGS